MALKLKANLASAIYDTFRSNLQYKNIENIYKNLKLVNDREGEFSYLCTIPLKDGNFLNSGEQKTVEEKINSHKEVAQIQFSQSKGLNVLKVQLKKKDIIKSLLDTDLHNVNFKPNSKRVVVEYSSPNIAKPFHVGHIRSTIIGNSIANVKKKLGHKVTKLNYLGDWGTQFGMIQLGVESQKYSLEDISRDPITLLYKAYVKGNDLAAKDSSAYEKAKKIFYDLENDDKETIDLWNKYRNWTKEELNTIYKRLGVEFDDYSWESDYKRKYADSVLKLLQEKGILSYDEQRRVVAKLDEQNIPLIKSDDTTLYLIRDLVAVLDRKSKYNFDELYYVVDNGQTDHFNKLFKLCNKLEITKNSSLEHVKFGKIHGMKTRKGKVIFLKDVLDEAAERAYKRQLESKTTKVSLDDKNVANIIGSAAILINDLKRKRKKDYDVVWEDILQFNGNTGSFLEYSYCRLCNLQLLSNKVAASECDPDAFKEPEAINLIKEISNYEQVLLKTDSLLEPCYLVNHLFNIAKTSNLAFSVLNIKHEDNYLGGQRLLLFEKCRKVLEDGLKILGVTPLTVM